MTSHSKQIARHGLAQTRPPCTRRHSMSNLPWRWVTQGSSCGSAQNRPHEYNRLSFRAPAFAPTAIRYTHLPQMVVKQTAIATRLFRILLASFVTNHSGGHFILTPVNLSNTTYVCYSGEAPNPWSPFWYHPYLLQWLASIPSKLPVATNF